MSDSGKHSALRQTDDGSFELVFDREGLQEVSEEEVSIAEVSSPEVVSEAAASSRVLLFSIIGVVVLLVLAAIGWVALSPAGQNDADTSEVAGFKPYVGGAEASDDKSQKQAQRKARLAAMAAEAEPDDEEVEVVEEVAEQVITEDEPGWELSEQAEDGVIVEVEGTDPEEEAEVAEADIVEEDVVEDAETETIRPELTQKRFEALRNADIGRQIQAPRVPGIRKGNPFGASRKLPIRNLRTAPTGDEDTEAEGEEVVDEDLVEDDEIIEEELE